jgi:uncharacterized protein (TIGR02284 family)
MATADNDVVDILNGLIETCKDGEQGFRQAAEKAKDPSFQSLFTKYASQRAGYVTELQQLVSGLGEKPATSGHFVANLHRGWIGLKSAISVTDQSLIDECEAGEDAAMKNYREATGQALPSNIAQVVARQFSGVQEAHGVIRDLKHSRAAEQHA